MEPPPIIIRGAQAHNLRGVDLEIPTGRLVVVTGVSGSGKSSLAHHVIYQEGMRRYLESLSAYSRQFLSKLDRPAVDHIDGLQPAISVDQRTVISSPRSTMGTMSEIHPHLRLLLARLGEPHFSAGREIESSLFSFNSPRGACPRCKGLGLEDRVGPELLVGDPSKTVREGALVLTTPTGYLVYSQVTMEVLDQVCQAHGFSVDIPWQRLTEEQQRVILHGSRRITIPFGKHTLESRLRWSGITAKPREEGYYRGIIPIIEEILRHKRNKNVLRFVRSTPCSACQGARLRPEALEVTFRGQHMAQLADLSVDALHGLTRHTRLKAAEEPVGRPLLEEIQRRCQLLSRLGLGYLQISRPSASLAGGEAQRVRLATQVRGGLRGLLYVLDEPSIGLHHRDLQRMLAVLTQLRDSGNTVLVVEHDETVMLGADWLVDMGPGAGTAGGRVLFSGPGTALLGEAAPQGAASSRTRAFLRGEEAIEVPCLRRPGEGELCISGATARNLQDLQVTFRLAALNVVSGVSGSGKSTLVREVLARALDARLRGAEVPPVEGARLKGAEQVDKLIEIDQSPIGRTPRSNPATYTKVFDPIRGLMAAQPEARARGWNKGRFSFNVKGGRCEDCQGAGVQTVGMHYLADVEVLCRACGGRRFNAETLQVRYRGHNVADVLDLSIIEALELFSDQPRIRRQLQAMADVGLGYISLGQPATTLSGGEAQRVKLSAELGRPSRRRTLYILDEPTTGLHPADINVLLRMLQGLVDRGNTAIVIEHNLDVIKVADWVVDLGPEGGAAGGRLMAAGTPEEVAAVKGSHTGAALRPLLEQRSLAPAATTRSPVHHAQPLLLRGVTTHNLQNIDVEIPAQGITVITGVSGSGKSSLALDTLAAEGQHCYTASLSTFARRFMRQARRGEVEEISGLTPVVAVAQQAGTRNPRSTLATLTGLHDDCRLLFARAGEPLCPACDQPLIQGACSRCQVSHPSLADGLFAGLFSFNHLQGACPTCRGLGAITRCDPARLVTHPSRSLLGGALDGHKTGAFYGDPRGQYVATLSTVGQELGLDFSGPYSGLSEEARSVALRGTGEREYQVIWRYQRNQRQGEHHWSTTWPGLANLVEEEFSRKHADRRGAALKELMREQACPACQGLRLRPEVLAVRFCGLGLGQLGEMTVARATRFFEELAQREGKMAMVLTISREQRSVYRTEPGASPEQALVRSEEGAYRAICDRRATPPGALRGVHGDAECKLFAALEPRRRILHRLQVLEEVGLSYLTLNRRASTLSRGETRRARLAGALGVGLQGVTYVLDEPTIGLHEQDTRQLIRVLQRLRDSGNRVVVVEHDAAVIRCADWIIDLGPGPGAAGGRVTFAGDLPGLLRCSGSLTGSHLSQPGAGAAPTPRRTLEEGIHIRGARANNLRGFDLHIPSGGIVVVAGVSGSGKSSLVLDVLRASHQAGSPRGCEGVSGLERFQGLVDVDQRPLGKASGSLVITYTGAFDAMRQLFARTPEARQQRFHKGHFSLNAQGGRCEVCRGAGGRTIGMGFLSDVWTTCEACGGARFDAATLRCRLRGHTIAGVLGLTVGEILEVFADVSQVRQRLEPLQEVGLGYLRLGQKTATLSSGEAQRMKLSSRLGKAQGKKTGAGRPSLLLFDEPTTGLHFADVERLLQVFHRLAEAGDTLLVIEHHPQILAQADWIIDLGPGAGEQGGAVKGSGTPEDLAREGASPTGALLRRLLA